MTPPHSPTRCELLSLTCASSSQNNNPQESVCKVYFINSGLVKIIGLMGAGVIVFIVLLGVILVM